MDRENKEFSIKNGPSKLDLMLSLFDTDMGCRNVEFRLDGVGNAIEVQIISAQRRNNKANVWDIKGTTKTKQGISDVSIYYWSDMRDGCLRFKDELHTHGVLETPEDARRAKALMIIINMMIGRYQNEHAGNLDEEIFKLFEKAKRVIYAENRAELAAAIEEIQAKN